MTPAARIQAAIELLGQIAALQRPADQVVSEYVRARRFMGAKDRRAVTDLVFAVLRARARLDWWWAAAGPEPRTAERHAHADAGEARARVLAALALIEGKTVADISALCDGRQYHPQPLDDGERRILEAVDGAALSDPRQPDWVRLEVPDWLLPSFREAFGADTDRELAALHEPAPVDLRVNALTAESRESAADSLREEGVETSPTPYAPWGLRVVGRRPVQATTAYRQGLVEVQDEGSQLVAALAGAHPGEAVCDFCAGAGGKTLALAAAMADRGRLVALDVDGKRLSRAGPRLERAGARNVERRLLADDGDPWLSEQAGQFHRVLVDAPCSGVGAWRRQPDSRWRLTPAALEWRMATQDAVLEQAAGLVRPGGRLVYATCSLLPEENRRRVAHFLDRYKAFRPVPIGRVWQETLGRSCPASGDDLTLGPARHATDGFYVAVLERFETD